MEAFTDYPFLELGDVAGKQAPIRSCVVTSYDGDKYCKIVVQGLEAEVKAGYLYKSAGRCGDVERIDVDEVRQLSDKYCKIVMRILTAVGYNCDDIWWRTDGEYAPISIFAKCSDLFIWGSADDETINAENISAFEQAYKDSPENGGLLFCCRIRKMRPQGAYYKYISDGEKHLFDACGEPREVGFGNPDAQC